MVSSLSRPPLCPNIKPIPNPFENKSCYCFTRVTQADRTSGFDKATSISCWKLWLAFTSHNAISKGIDYERCHIFGKLLTKFMFLPKTLKASFTQSMLTRKQTSVIVVITLPWKGPRFLAPTILFRTMTINETARIGWWLNVWKKRRGWFMLCHDICGLCGEL